MKFLPLLFLLALVGCNGSGLTLHVRTALTFRALNDEAAEIVEESCHRLATDAARNPQLSPEEAERAAETIITRCMHVAERQHTVATAYEAWRDGLLLSITEPEPNFQWLVRLLRALRDAWTFFEDAAEYAGFHLPPLPQALLDLLGGGQ